MDPKTLDFANGALSAGTQPTKILKILLDKFGSKLISGNLIDINQKLIG
jgi:hypothetical protein